VATDKGKSSLVLRAIKEAHKAGGSASGGLTSAPVFAPHSNAWDKVSVWTETCAARDSLEVTKRQQISPPKAHSPSKCLCSFTTFCHSLSLTPLELASVSFRSFRERKRSSFQRLFSFPIESFLTRNQNLAPQEILPQELRREKPNKRRSTVKAGGQFVQETQRRALRVSFLLLLLIRTEQKEQIRGGKVGPVHKWAQD